MAVFCQPQAAKPLQKNHSAHAWPSRLFRARATLNRVPTSIRLMRRALQINCQYVCRDGNNLRKGYCDAAWVRFL